MQVLCASYGPGNTVVIHLIVGSALQPHDEKYRSVCSQSCGMVLKLSYFATFTSEA